MREPDQRADRLAQATIGAAIAVHRALGPGFTEAVYEEALWVELQERNIAVARQAVVTVRYRGRIVGEGRLDLLVGDCLIVELKAVEALAPLHIAQVLSYLKMTGHTLGLLINFNVRVLTSGGVKRVVLS